MADARTRTRNDMELWFLAALGYEAVAKGMGWLLPSGAPLPPWHQQSEAVRNAVYDAQAAARFALSLMT